MIKVEDIVAEALKLPGMKDGNRKMVQMQLEALANDLWEYPWIFTRGIHTQTTLSSTRLVTLTGAKKDIASLRGAVRYGNTNEPLDYIDDDHLDQRMVGIVSAGRPSCYCICGKDTDGLIIEMDSYGGEDITYRYYKKVVDDIYSKFPDSFIGIFLNIMLFMFDPDPSKAQKALAMADTIFARRQVEFQYGSDQLPTPAPWRHRTTRMFEWAKQRRY